MPKKNQYLILHVVIIIIAREELGNWAIGRGRDWAREEPGEGLMRMMVMMVMTMTMTMMTMMMMMMMSLPMVMMMMMMVTMTMMMTNSD